MSIPDPIGELVALLAADPGVAALAAGRVFGGGLTDADQAGMPAATVIVNAAGGPGRPGRLIARRTRIDTICYGATLHQAWELHLAVRDALENAETTGSVKAVQVSSDGVTDIDPVTQWPVCLASYLVLSTTHL